MKAEAECYDITHIKESKASNYKHACSLDTLLKKNNTKCERHKMDFKTEK